jgi:hypothetical protein
MQIDRIDPAFGHWFAGFVDGEGCFYVRRARHPYRGKIYETYGCSLTLAVRDDDLPILQTIVDKLGMGVISRYKPRQSAEQRPVACLSIHNKADVLGLVEFFDTFSLQSKKARDYEVWRRAVLEWHRERGAKTRGRDWSVMAQLHQELKDVRRYAA